MIADDLFAGAGGWDLAADLLGIHARGVENMPEARATRDAAGLATVHDDVWTYDPLHAARREAETTAEVYARVYRETGSGVIAGVAAGLIASPPCQTFSQAGSGSGRKALDAVLTVMADLHSMTLPDLREAGKAFGDDRTALVLTPLWYLLHHRTYRWAAWEQVPTVLPVWQACAEVLRAEGWHVWTGMVHAEQYGVPQTRKRAVLIASRDREVGPPPVTHSRYHSRTPGKLDPGVRKWVSMAEGLGWGLRERPSPTITGGGTETGGAEPIAKLARYTERDDWSDRPVQLMSGTRDKAVVRREDEPAMTLAFGHDAASFCWAPEGTTPAELVALKAEAGRDESDWVLRNNNTANAAERAPEEPAPTLYFGQRSNYCAWEWRGEGPMPAHPSEGYDPRETTPDGLPRFAQQSDNVPDYAWPDERRATTVAGRDLVQAPGATANRYNGSTKSRNDGVRVSVAEAGVLQSFPADFPWQGKQGKRYLQAGNAFPPGVALHVLAMATGMQVPVRGCTP